MEQSQRNTNQQQLNSRNNQVLPASQLTQNQASTGVRLETENDDYEGDRLIMRGVVNHDSSFNP